MEITSRKNPAVVLLRTLVNERKTRRSEGLFVIEGAKLAREAVKSGLEITSAYATKAAEEKYHDIISEVEDVCAVKEITADVADYISDTKTPQGIFLTARLLDKPLTSDIIKAYRKIMILENLQDTGNVGTVIRTADAMGISAVVLSNDTADIYSPKVIRGAMGSLFRLPCFVADLSEALPLLSDCGFTSYAAMLDSEAMSLGSFSFPEKSAVVIGNEGNGITAQTLSLCSKKVYIPIKNAESLNAAVAASVICWELGRQ